jgi:sec-independent protein translocase protein TatA
MQAALAAIVALDLESGLPIILILVLVLFGGAQLPKLARGLGSAQKEFKKGLEEGAEDTDKDKNKAKPETTSD